MNKYFKTCICIFDNDLEESDNKLKKEKIEIIVKKTFKGYNRGRSE